MEHRPPGQRRNRVFRLLSLRAGERPLRSPKQELHTLGERLPLHRRAGSILITAPHARLATLRKRKTIRSFDVVQHHERLSTKAPNARAHQATIGLPRWRE